MRTAVAMGLELFVSCPQEKKDHAELLSRTAEELGITLCFGAPSENGRSVAPAPPEDGDHVEASAGFSARPLQCLGQCRYG